MTNNLVLEVKNLTLVYRAAKKEICALNNFSLSLEKSQAVAIVGGSGSGKSTLAYSILGILKEKGGTLKQGSICFPQEKDTSRFSMGRVAYIPQDPHRAFDPLFTIADHFREAVTIYKPLLNQSAQKKLVEDLLKQVEMPFTWEDLNRFAHELSGGEKQRLLIALALIAEPYLIIADEPTSSLDVTIQAEMMRLFEKIIHENKAALLFITHHLVLAKRLCQKTCVLNQGVNVETNETALLFKEPQHRYTQALLEAIPGRTNAR
jgi:ABC-type dipeptide/oligopeptide/nickel transport system ATPase component